MRYVQNRRAKNLSIRINQQGEVRVTIPRYVSRKRAEAFLMSKKTWILRKLSEINHAVETSQMPVAGERISVRGKEIPILLQKGDRDIEDAIWRILLQEGQEYLPGRVKELAAIHGFRFTGVKVRRMKTRWGSCTQKNGINLNSWLMMLPEPLSDYVILHELVHTVHRDHGRRFWEALDERTNGHSRQLRKELRQRRIMLIHPED